MAQRLLYGTITAGRIVEAATENTLTDSTLVKSGAGVLTLSAAGTYTLTVPATGTAALINYANTGYFRVSSDSDSAGYFAVGAIPASVGSIRLPYASTMNFRNEANDGDVAVFWVNSGDQLRIGNSTNPLGTSIYGGTGVAIYTGGSTSVRAIAIGASTAFSMTINPDKAANASGHYLQTLINTAVYGSSVLGVYGNGRDHVYIGALDTTTGQTCTIQPFADRVALRVTGFATQTASRTLVNLIRNDSNTNVVAPVITATVNSTGTAAAGFGGAIALNLESATTADQTAAALKWLWTDATHVTRTSRADIETTGPGHCAAWGYNGVDGTARYIINNGTGDVTEGVTVQYVASEVTGTDSYGGVVYLEPSDSFAICTDGTNTLVMTCAADGSLYVQRSAGTDTFKFSCWAVWQ